MDSDISSTDEKILNSLPDNLNNDDDNDMYEDCDGGDMKEVRKKDNVEGSEVSEDTLFKKDFNDEEYLKESFSDDLYITVSDPNKHVHKLETFISYKVTTKTTRSTFDCSEFVVSRRYHDFEWLVNMLEEEHPSLLIPPLPSKFIVKGIMDRFGSEFIETRCRALHQFLQRIADHPVLSFSEHLKNFLINENFTSSGKAGLLSRVSSSLKRGKVNNPEFDSINDVVSLFGEKMAVMDRVNERLLSEKQELVSDLRDMVPALADWGGIEDEATENIMTSVSSCFESCAEEAATNKNTHKLELLPPMKEYNIFADSVKQALKRRGSLQLQFEKCCEELKVKKEDKENLFKADQSYSFGALMGMSPELVRQQKEDKLTQQVDALTQHRENLSNELEKFNCNLKADLKRWNELKVRDLAGGLSLLAEAQTSYHDNCTLSWKNILSFMELPEQTSEVDDDISLPI